MDELDGLENGIYLGWANVSGGEVYKTAMSIGENPFFHGKERTIVSRHTSADRQQLA